MSLWDRLFSHNESKPKALAGPLGAGGFWGSQFWTPGQPVWTDRRYDRMGDEAYSRNAVAYRCVKMIAGAAASIPWKL